MVLLPNSGQLAAQRLLLYQDRGIRFLPTRLTMRCTYNSLSDQHARLTPFSSAQAEAYSELSARSDPTSALILAHSSHYLLAQQGTVIASGETGAASLYRLKGSQTADVVF